MKINKGLSTAIAIIIVLVVIGGGYYLYQQTNESDEIIDSIDIDNDTENSKEASEDTDEVTFEVIDDKETSKEYSCRVVCTGAVPSENVVSDCRGLLTEKQCTSYSSVEFPSKCMWKTRDYSCPPLP